MPVKQDEIRGNASLEEVFALALRLAPILLRIWPPQGRRRCFGQSFLAPAGTCGPRCTCGGTRSTRPRRKLPLCTCSAHVQHRRACGSAAPAPVHLHGHVPGAPVPPGAQFLLPSLRRTSRWQTTFHRLLSVDVPEQNLQLSGDIFIPAKVSAGQVPCSQSSQYLPSNLKVFQDAA